MTLDRRKRSNSDIRNYASRFRASGARIGAAISITVFITAGTASSAFATTDQGLTEPTTLPGPVTMRRLNESQYRNSIAAAFGSDVKVPGRFEPPLREQGLLAIGDGKAVVSASGVEQDEFRAREIASQVLSEKKRQELMPCRPASETAVDKKCASEFLGKYGRVLFRRPLTAQELASVTSLAGMAAKRTGDFYKGLEFGLARLLESPNFIFRVERSVVDLNLPGKRRLDDFSLATRVSFLLWNMPPDAQLLQAAETGALHQPGELKRQVNRLIAAPAFEQGVRAFFSDMFAFERFDGLSKDQAIYPKYSSALAKSAQEQYLRTIVDLLVTNKGDYRDLFVTKKTFMNRRLASLYKVPLAEEAGLDGWVPYTFGERDPRAGIFSLAGFLMLDPTHEGRSSPTIRGKSVRELFLCQPVPIPPPNVDSSAVQNTKDPLHKTARDRLSVHQENPVCRGCHSLTDPIGLSMENYDSIGSFRVQENGATIDASGVFERKPYRDVIGLQQLLRGSPATTHCAVQRAFEYGVGRSLTPSENEWLDYATKSFAQDNYQFPELLRRIAESKAFQAASTEAVVAK